MNITYSLDEIDQVAKQIINGSKHKIFLFYGAMGAGKTTLIKEIIKELGCAENISSPTFSIVNEYLTEEKAPIYHFDFYRIKDPYEALDLGFEDYLQTEGWIFIEWPEKINIFLPLNAHSANIESLNGSKRKLIIN